MPASDSSSADARFTDLGLPAPILQILEELGYESPTPIQAQTIPLLLEGRDLLGQAQTGTGKTAAFALPALSLTQLKPASPQTLVLAPTRELAIQVAEAFQRYATHLPGFHVLPIYGGQSYVPQLKGLRRGVHVVVGTPGRVVDHIKRGTLNLDSIRMLVLDEADEMLRMGFIDDVEWVLQQTPANRQVALFSATMPSAIRRVAQTYLKSPAEIHVKSKTTTATNIRQRYWLVSGANKLEGLTRILEAETFDAMIIFARTKLATNELAERLEARGFAAAALNGDLDQKQRERTVAKLKNRILDIVVATDVAARGLDVERISHVLNYDIPTDTESYVHRIGRTGRAGRSGEAILFVAPREKHLLRAIERATRQSIGIMALPTDATIQDKRLERFEKSIIDALEDEASTSKIEALEQMILQVSEQQSVPPARIAAVLAHLAQASKSAVVPAGLGETTRRPRSETPRREERDRPSRPSAPPIEQEPPSRQFFADAPRDKPSTAPVGSPHPVPEKDRAKPVRSRAKSSDEELEPFRVEVGEKQGAKPGNLVGAIANEAGLDAAFIGRIEIHDDYSIIDLPVGMPRKILRDLQKVWVSGHQLKMSRVNAKPVPESAGKPAKPAKPFKKKHKPKT